jgi:hypothetical protein
MTELNKYKNGKVYKIEPIVDHDEEDIYIGSTCQPYLSSRMNQHRSDYNKFKKNTKNNISTFLLFDKYGVENCNIILIESVEANNKMELHQREAHYIKTLKCINKCIPLRTDKEYYEDNKDILLKKQKQYIQKNKEYISTQTKVYRELHKDILLKKKKEYYKVNTEKISLQKKEYREKNDELIKKRKKEYYEANKDAINAKQRERRQLKKQEEQII